MLNYFFKNRELLTEALTHHSLLNEIPEENRRDNECLEFLGDAVLGVIISVWLMQQFPDEKEGGLTRLRSSLVKEKRLCEVSRQLGLGEYLHLGKGEERMDGRKKPSVQADAFEAMVGAIYLDGGMPAAQQFVREQFQPFMTAMKDNQNVLTDPKTRVQELLLGLFRSPP